jgi:flagellar hook assembly protein FlgD
VRTLHRGELAADVEHVFEWDGRDARGKSLASGVYFVAVEAPDFTRRQKVALIK